MKTIKEIEKEVAKECAEEHFEVLLEAEISVGDYETARRLLITVANRYIDQFIETKMVPVKTKETFEEYLKRNPCPDTRSFTKEDWETDMYERWKEDQ